jgi:ketosteroid isomerase-like protein
VDPEIDVQVPAGGLLEGTYRGHADVSKFLESFWDAFENHHIEIEECIPAGDDVLLTVHAYGRGKTSGVEVNLRAWHIWTLRGGKAVRWRIVNTRGEALEAVGLSEQDAHAEP